MPRRQFSGSALPDSVESMVERVLEDERGVETQSMIRRWALRESAPAEIPKLIRILSDKAPGADAAVCLVIVRILEQHADALCPVEPLLDVLVRGDWVAHQRAAYGVYYAWNSDNDALRERACRALIPLTASQRGRVVYPTLACLKEITGLELGRDPGAWARWFESEFGSPIELDGVVNEMVAVVTPLGVDPFRPPWDLNGVTYRDKHSLLRQVKQLKHEADEHKVPLRVVMHSDHAAEEFERPKLLKVFRESLMVRLISLAGSVEIAHESDQFYPPHR